MQMQSLSSHADDKSHKITDYIPNSGRFAHYFLQRDMSSVRNIRNETCCGCIEPKSVISVMMITTLVFDQMSLRFEGAMGFHCNRKTERQMTKRKFVCA